MHTHLQLTLVNVINNFDFILSYYWEFYNIIFIFYNNIQIIITFFVKKLNKKEPIKAPFYLQLSLSTNS
mgnify:CR=1 FL=1